ncbi:hypothetical protein AHAS_Ahas13G0032000 [Arachis hypogaea]
MENNKLLGLHQCEMLLSIHGNTKDPLHQNIYCRELRRMINKYIDASIVDFVPLKLITGETVGEVKAVAGMHQRKAEMAKHSDAFIALPGGYGTLEELLEVITWAQLGIHDKPVGLLNVDGYYNSLLSFIDKAVEEGFISPKARHIIVSAPSPKELVKKMEEYSPQHERVASKLSWEAEQVGSYTSNCDISR